MQNDLNEITRQSELNSATLFQHQAAMLELLKILDEICKKLNIPYMLFAGSMLGAVRHKGFIPWDDDVDVVMLRKDYEYFLKTASEEIDKERYFIQAEHSEHWPMYFSKLRMNNTTCLEKYHPKDSLIHQGVYIDIFPCDNASDISFVRKIQFLCSKIVIANSLEKRGYDTNSICKKLLLLFSKIAPVNLLNKIAKSCNKNSTKYVHTFFGGSSKYNKSIYPREWFKNIIYADFENNKFPVSASFDEFLTLLYGDYMTLPKIEDRYCKKHAILVDLEHSYEYYSHFRDEMKFEVLTRSIR